MNRRERRHWAGEPIEVDGWHLRVVTGDKGHRSADGKDFMLQLWADGQWRTLELGMAFVVMDVIGQNEDYLYADGEGGGKTYKALRLAYRDGWQVAWEQLQRERKDRDERDRQRQIALRHQPPQDGLEWARRMNAGDPDSDLP